MSLEIPGEDGESPLEVWIDDDGYICLTDEINNYELSFSQFNWRALVEYVDQKLRERMS
jgi:hypothetical protein